MSKKIRSIKSILKNRENINRLFNYAVPAFIVIMLISLVVCLIDNKLGLSKRIFDEADKGSSIAVDFFLVEVQVAFITLSLSTVLSTSSKRVYWEETYKYRLISPLITNFTALSAYILASLLDGLIWCVVDSITKISGVLCILLSFVLSIVFLVFLTARMIDANFGKEKIKKELEDKLAERCKAIPNPQHIGMDKGRMLWEIHRLKQITIQEIDEKELELVCENMLLFIKFDFRIELRELYNYAQNVLSSNAVMNEINYLIMKEVIRDNKIQFFYIDCPIPVKTRLDLWELIIHDIFDEAHSLWNAGDIKEALELRKNLYVMLTQYLNYEWECLDCPAYDENTDEYVDPSDEEIDDGLSRLIHLMAVFVSRRQNVWYGFIMDDDLDENWSRSERELVDNDTFVESYEDTSLKMEPVNKLEELCKVVQKTLDDWSTGGWPQSVSCEDSNMMDMARYY